MVTVNAPQKKPPLPTKVVSRLTEHAPAQPCIRGAVGGVYFLVGAWLGAWLGGGPFGGGPIGGGPFGGGSFAFLPWRSTRCAVSVSYG